MAKSIPTLSGVELDHPQTIKLIMPLEDHLPPELEGPSTTIARIAEGMSGAGVYRDFVRRF